MKAGMRATAGGMSLAILLASASVWAKGPKTDDDDSASSDDDDQGSADTDKKSDKAKAKSTTKDDEDDATIEDDKTVEDKTEASQGDTGSGSAAPAVKQDLNGHDLAATHKRTQFERDRFFVDKVDTDDTADKTLIQGSFTSSTFFYTEFGGAYPTVTPAMGQQSVVDNALYSILWTDLRLQTDFRHISGSRWDARVDARVRLVDQPPSTLSQYDANAPATSTATPTQNAVQSGFNGQNEYDLRELWVIRNGVQTDVTIGRQFIADLGGLKIDGVRVDYASSDKLTLLGFVGLYPLRGSRSVTTDYETLYTQSLTTGLLSPVTPYVGAGGFGGAYRTGNAYGAVGAVMLAPLQGESPRIYATSNGYWRYGSTLDIYHFALVDLIGENDALDAAHAGLTNLSAGINYKPDPRLRLTASFNRVDTDTLNVQAYAFLHNVDSAVSLYDNQAYLVRLSTDEARVGASAGLGDSQRFEISTALTYRTNPSFELTAPTGQVIADIGRAQSIEAWGGITDRRSIAGLRLSLSVSRTFGIGSVTYQHNQSLALRAMASHELLSGKGEWELEAEYASVQDSLAGESSTTAPCTTAMQAATCFGSSNGTIITVGGLLYYRLNRNWFTVASLYLNEESSQGVMLGAMMTGVSTDPAITGLTGFLRLAYRF